MLLMLFLWTFSFRYLVVFFSECEYERCQACVIEDTSAIAVRWQESVELNRKNFCEVAG